MNKKWLIVGGVIGLAGVLLVGPGCSVFGVRKTPEPDYQVTQEIEGEPIEIRVYKPMILATTIVETTDYKEGSRVGFRRLADYIFGENRSNEKIGMTAPVYQTSGEDDADGEKIGMTAPVYQEEGKDGVWKMAFVMPERYTLETLPKPLDPAIKLTTQPAKTFAVLRFRGRYNERNIERHRRQLESWLDASGEWEATSKTRAAGYDPPFTLPMFRRNEILVEVEPKR